MPGTASTAGAGSESGICGACLHSLLYFGLSPGLRFRDNPRRPEGTTRQSFGEFVLDGVARQLFRCGRTVHLTPKAFDLLGLLVDHGGRALSKEEIHERLWPEVHVSESNLPVLMHELRVALEDDAQDPRWIRTLSRYGYVFCGEVRADDGDAGTWECPWDCRLLWRDLEILLRPGENVLGRSRDAAVWVDDASVSRRHAIVRVSDSGPTLEDCGSRNGTFLHGHRVRDPVILADGDELVLGSVMLLFRCFRA
jgi:DNA-binding winged helix-turn-helix (wHTH) protein